MLIEGCYAVRESSPLAANEEVDRPGATVVVGQGSAYDLFLTRELKQATILRAPSSPAVIEHFWRMRRMSLPGSGSSSRRMPCAWAGCGCSRAGSW